MVIRTVIKKDLRRLIGKRRLFIKAREDESSWGTLVLYAVQRETAMVAPVSPGGQNSALCLLREVRQWTSHRVAWLRPEARAIRVPIRRSESSLALEQTDIGPLVR